MVIEAKDFEEFNAGNYDIAGTQTRLEPAEPNMGEVVELEEGEELWEMEVDEDAILYYIEDEDGNEIGFAIEEDGKEVEYYYAADDECDCGCGHDHEAEELYDMEVDEDAILYYIEDEDGNEIGFAIEEDGKEVEYFYAEDEAPAPAPAAAAAGNGRVYADSLLGDIRRKTDGLLEKAEDKLDNGEMSEEAKKVMGGVAEAADTLKEFKDTMRDLRDAFSFRL